MMFMGEIPESIRRGQSLRLRIELGNPSIATLIPVEVFIKIQEKLIYVQEAGSNMAVKRNIRLGRKNTGHYEVVQGLNPGERVIISSYNTFGENEMLVW